MKEHILLKDESGKIIECEILFTFESNETNKSYIIYTDNTFDELGNLKVYANTYDPNSEKGSFGEITTKREWALIEQIMNSIEGKKEE